jgi:cell division protein FtsB
VVSTRAVTRSRARARSRFTARAAILGALVSALLIAAIFPVRTYLSERSQITDLTRQAQVLEQRNAKLAAQIQRLHDPEYLEKLARECLGMVRPGEVAFVVVPKGGGPKPAAC